MATCKECGQEIPHYTGRPLTNTMYRYVDTKTGKFAGIINSMEPKIVNKDKNIDLTREDLYSPLTVDGLKSIPTSAASGAVLMDGQSVEQSLKANNVTIPANTVSIQKVVTGLDLSPGAGIVQQSAVPFESNPNLGKKVV